MQRAEASQLVRSLFTGWYSSAVRYACRLSGSLEVAEDCVQEAFKALYVQLVGGTVIDDPRRWTLCVVRRTVGKHQRMQRRHAEHLLPDEELDLIPDPRSVGRHPAMEQDDLSEWLAVLTTREEEVVMLRVNGFRYREIAADLGISQNSVKTLLARALRKLREKAAADMGQTGRAQIERLDVRETLH